MKIVIKHNGQILDLYGFGNIDIPEIKPDTHLNQIVCGVIKKRIQFRNNELWDFEYGIGGFHGDEYYKIKNIKFSNNNTEIIVKVSKI
jgi:hypothetical protein